MKKYIKKILLIGNHGVGKTSLATRYVENKFSDAYLSTIGVNIMKKILILEHEEENVEVAIMIWDVEGSVKTKAIPAHYAKGCNGFIVVVDNTRPETLESLQMHIDYIHAFDSSVPFVIAINKSDLDSEMLIDEREILKQYENCRCVMQTSAKLDNNVKKLFETITNATL
jgi:small GTP-binding protein